MPTREEFKTKLTKLIEQFENNEKYYKSQAYKEDELRQEFINPFFKSLGWDMENEGQVAPQYRDVIHEDRVQIEGKPKAPDYSFRVGSERKFFVEAKAALVKVISEFPPSFQLRRYAWSGKLPISILTDFEEFSIYDTTIEPKQSDRTDTARIKYIHYKDYLKEADYLWDTFSKEAVWKGSFDKFARATKRGGELVDKKFLDEIEQWRSLLAKDIAINNKNIDIYELNEAVQRIIDRIIFLRIAEDRGIEFYENLKKTIEAKDTYSKLVNIFERAQKKYNSNLFDFNEDKLTRNLKISDKVLDRIIGSVYYPRSPYEFSVIGVGILGSVYERFLGKVIRLTKGHKAIIEEKPEVKKAGGVYYTPQYIVDYIVKNTVGELVKGKTPKEVSKLKIVDPACGSGSFLIGAYDYLLEWHLKYYIDKDTDKYLKSKTIFKDPEGNYLLSSAEKKRILVNNIYGVDIDPQAVEVTKLSLALKILENENSETINAQLKMFADRILPDLSPNIKCGNSLIGSDYYNDKNLSMFGEDEIRKVNAFDWETEFSEVFKQGGFDAVIGNPPYLRIQGLQEYYKEQILYYQHQYESAVKRFDLYLLFMEKGFSLLNKNGVLGYINPHKFVNGDFGSAIRNFLVKYKALDSIISFGSYPVFESASTYTGIMKLSKKNKDNFRFYEINSRTESAVQDELNKISTNDFAIYQYNLLSNSPWSLTNQTTQGILNKIKKIGKPLENFFEEIAQGLVTGIDEIYFLQITNNTDLAKDVTKAYSPKIKQEIEIESKIIKPTLKGEDVSRFVKPKANIVCIYPYKKDAGKTKILEHDELYSQFPLAYDYLNRFKSELIGIRKAYKTNPRYWYSCHRGRKINLFESLRIITPEISLGCNMTIGEPGIYHNTMVYSLLPKTTTQEDLHYWLGLLNSNILWWFLTNTGNVLRGGYFRFKTNYLKPFPTRTIDFKNLEDKKNHDSVVEAVKKLLTIHSKLNGATGEMSKILKKQAAMNESKLNAIIYNLYDLNQKEIELIDSALPKKFYG